MKRFTALPIGLALWLTGFPAAAHGSTPHPYAPHLSVHEFCYGTAPREGRRESLEGLEIRIVNRLDHSPIYRVECFFLKKARHGGPPSVDDVAIFEVTDPHATYRVMAKPIPLPGGGKASTGKKSSKTSKATAPSTFTPREGFLVRILHGGEIVREHASSHALGLFARENPELLSKAAEGKKTRHLDSTDLIVR